MKTRSLDGTTADYAGTETLGGDFEVARRAGVKGEVEADALDGAYEILIPHRLIRHSQLTNFTCATQRWAPLEVADVLLYRPAKAPSSPQRGNQPTNLVVQCPYTPTLTLFFYRGRSVTSVTSPRAQASLCSPYIVAIRRFVRSVASRCTCTGLTSVGSAERRYRNMRT